MHRIGWALTRLGRRRPPKLEALRPGLRKLSYVEGQNITIEVRWADGRTDRLPRLASELVRLPVDVLCLAGSQASGAAKQATSTIPIVFVNVAFPDQSGLVASYSRPGANITGVAFIFLNTGSGWNCSSWPFRSSLGSR
jgi:putative ABC transport system substrate-binding protein